MAKTKATFAFLLKLKEYSFTKNKITASRNHFYTLVTDELQQLGVAVKSDKDCQRKTFANIKSYLQKTFDEHTANKRLIAIHNQSEISDEEIEALARQYQVAVVLFHATGTIQVSKPIEFGPRVLYLAKTHEGQIVVLYKDPQASINAYKFIHEVIDAAVTGEGDCLLSEGGSLPQTQALLYSDEVIIDSTESHRKQHEMLIQQQKEFLDEALNVHDDSFRNKVGSAFNIKKILGNGNCGYYAVIDRVLDLANEKNTVETNSYQVEEAWHKAVKYLRLRICQHIGLNINFYIPFYLDKTEVNVIEELNPQLHPEHWIEDPELSALAQILKYTIVIIDDALPKPIIFKPVNSSGIIYLGRINEGYYKSHYVSLIKKANTEYLQNIEKEIAATPVLSEEKTSSPAEHIRHELINYTQPLKEKIQAIIKNGEKYATEVQINAIYTAINAYHGNEEQLARVKRRLNRVAEKNLKQAVLTVRSQSNASLLQHALFAKPFYKVLIVELLNFGFTINPLAAALAYHGETETLLELVKLDEKQILLTDEAGYLAIHYAAAAGHEETVIALLERYPHLLQANKNATGKTALQLTIENGHFNLANRIYLLAQQTEIGLNIEHAANEYQFKFVLQYLYKANPTLLAQLHPFYQQQAIKALTSELCKTLINTGLPSDAIIKEIDTYLAAVKTHSESAKALLTEQLSLTEMNSTDNKIIKPNLILEAIYHRYHKKEVIYKFIELGIEFPTPACKEAYTGNSHTVTEMLATAEASFTIPDYAGYLPIHYAVIAGNIEAAKLILEKFPEQINHQENEQAIAPLYAAIYWYFITKDENYLEIADYLVALHADGFLKTKSDEYAFSFLISIPAQTIKNYPNLMQTLANISQPTTPDTPSDDSTSDEEDEELPQALPENKIFTIEREKFYDELQKHLVEEMKLQDLQNCRETIIEALCNMSESKQLSYGINQTILSDTLENTGIVSTVELRVINEIYKLNFAYISNKTLSLVEDTAKINCFKQPANNQSTFFERKKFSRRLDFDRVASKIRILEKKQLKDDALYFH